MRRVKVYSLYERLWHWLQAVAIIALLLTGLEIHAPNRFHLFGFAHATKVHEVIALVVTLNAFLSLFYHLSTGALRKFIPEPKDFVALAIAQAKYYAYGIFTGAEHPLKGSRRHAFNPLQQVTYVGILNIVLPLQVITGVLVWWAPSWPRTIANLGGLGMLARMHTLLAWFLAAFIIFHIYLSTTGPTPLAYFKTMIFGWDEEDRKEPRFEGSPEPLPKGSGKPAATP
jgi:thiosulfate reductase cytochrome b subunit